MQAWSSLAHNGDSTDILLRGMDDFSALERLERARFRFLTMNYFKIFENARFQYRIGTLLEADWQAISADMHSVFSAPGTHTVWPLIKNRFNSEFCTLVDQVVLQQASAVANYKPPQAARPKTNQRKSAKA